MATYPKDRFDSVPDDLLRTGAHRSPEKKGRGWVAFAWAALATGVLVLAGAIGLAAVRGGIELPFSASSSSPSAAPSVTPTPTVTPQLNPTLSISILNGTQTVGLAGTVGDALVKQGWNGASVAHGFRGNAATRDIKQTMIFYSDPANEGAAKAIQLSLKGGVLMLSKAYPDSPITVVLGSDYKVPAK